MRREGPARGRVRFAAIAFASMMVLSQSCDLVGGMGDASEIVRLKNTLDVPVNVYQTNGSQPQPSELLQPNQTVTNQWLVPAKRDGRRPDGYGLRWIEAKTETGELVFCHKYTPTELDGLQWMIEVRRSNDCK